MTFEEVITAWKSLLRANQPCSSEDAWRFFYQAGQANAVDCETQLTTQTCDHITDKQLDKEMKMQVVAEVVDNNGPYVHWYATEGFYTKHPVGTKFYANLDPKPPVSILIHEALKILVSYAYDSCGTAAAVDIVRDAETVLRDALSVSLTKEAGNWHTLK